MLAASHESKSEPYKPYALSPKPLSPKPSAYLMFAASHEKAAQLTRGRGGTTMSPRSRYEPVYTNVLSPCSPGRLVISSRFPEVMTVPLASGNVSVRCCVGVSRLHA
jgi:hypothetical protein